MAGFFGKKAGKPADYCKQARDAVTVFEKGTTNAKSLDKANAALLASVGGLRATLVEAGEDTAGIVAVAKEVFAAELLGALIGNLQHFDLEVKKEVTLFFSQLVRRSAPTEASAVDHLAAQPTILATLCTLYDTDTTTNCGSMLRDCAAYEPLVDYLLSQGSVWEFFTYTESANFDVQSDAFATFRELLTVHKAMVAEFLETNYDKFFDEYTKLLSSTNYVTRRMSLKLLGELLLDRANFNIMSKYISDLENLKRVMNLLRDKSKNIQFEAFHVFKVFVANPNKPAAVTHILVKNRDKLVQFLSSFQNEKEDDQFTEEKAFLLKQIQGLTE